MALSATAARLTEAHRLAQARLGAQTVRAMLGVWPLLDPQNLDGTEARWIRAATPIVRAQRATSARLAANYLRAFRRLELPGVPDVTAVLAESIPVEQIAASLHVTGPVAVKRHMAISPITERAMEIGRTMSAASSMRHALDGGRLTIVETVQADDRALGWARATSGRACAFCAMLASRGPVYRKETAEFEAHDHCSCGVEPVYHENAAWPAGARRYQEIWQQAKKLDGDTTQNFRRLIEAA